MSRNIRVRGVRREQPDLTRLAAAVAALAAEQRRREEDADGSPKPPTEREKAA